MSDTPETDAELYPMNGMDIVWPCFARQLERERDQLKQLLAADSERVDAYLGVCIERDEAREKLDEEMKWHNRTHTELVQTQCKILDMQMGRDELRDKYDKLATEYMLAVNKLCEERDEARDALSDWENAALHVEAEHPDEKHCGCVPVLRKLLADARKERDEARELLRILIGLVAYGLGQSGEEWSLDAMRQATAAIQNAKSLQESK